MNKYKNQIVQFKIFGERHTATNAIARLLIQNFNLDYPYYDFLGWKHRKAPSAKELQDRPLVQRTLFVITVRHPYQWVAAMHRWPYCDYDALIHRYNLRRFLNYPIEDYAHVLDLWNQKYASYQEFIKIAPYVKVVRYEEFKKDQIAVLRRFYDYLPKPKIEKPVNQYMHGGDAWTLQFTERIIDNIVYRHWLEFPPESSRTKTPKKRPLEKITKDVAEIIDKEIDKSILNYYYPESINSTFS